MSVDEIQYFESSVQQVQSEQNAFYNEMIQIVTPGDLAHLDQIIQKSKNYLYAKNNETPKQWTHYWFRSIKGTKVCIYSFYFNLLFA